MRHSSMRCFGLFNLVGQLFWTGKRRKRFNLLPQQLRASRRALIDYGNASSNTIGYVMEYMIEESLKMKEMTEKDPDGIWYLLLGLGLSLRGFFQEILFKRLPFIFPCNFSNLKQLSTVSCAFLLILLLGQIWTMRNQDNPSFFVYRQ